MCHEICHPYKIPSMNGVNSMVCEQTNYDTGKWRPGTKHMNVERYNFFLIVFDYRNHTKLDGTWVKGYEPFPQKQNSVLYYHLYFNKRKLPNFFYFFQ